MKKTIKLLVLIFALTTVNNFAQILKPGDGIDLTFFNIQEKINGKYYIQDNGKIQLPYLGLINTVNRDFAAVRNEIINKYSRIYKNPEINVEALFRIDVLGEVHNAGIYYAKSYETLTDVLAKAGGETNDADIDGIFIIRDNNKMEIDVQSVFENGNTMHDIGIRSGDKIYVPRTWWVTARDASVIVSGVAVLVAIVGLFTK